MPIIRLYPNGSTAGVAPSRNDHKRAKRGTIQGWTPRAARGQRKWFYSIPIHELTGVGYSFTLTVRDVPPSSTEFHRLRDRFLTTMRRKGAIRAHWLIEWQRRGAPHLHGCLYFPEAGDPGFFEFLIVKEWVRISKAYGTHPRGQNCKPIYDSVGWLKYLAKHGARGVSHYQRTNDNIPKDWKKTGRLWGYQGNWPIRESMNLTLGLDGYHDYRRLCRRFEIATARANQDWRGVAYARRMLKCSEKNLSFVRGVSDWIPTDVTLQLVAHVAAQGHDVRQVWQD